MSFQQFQTAAVRVFRLIDPSDRDVTRLPWPLHPHDAEAVLRPAEKPLFSQYAGTSMLRIPRAQFEPERNELRQPAELTLVWRDTNLLVVTRGASDNLDACLDTVLKDISGREFGTAAEVVTELLVTVTHEAQDTIRTFCQALTPSIEDRDAQWVAELCQAQAEAVTLARTAENTGLTETTNLRLKLVAHQFRHLQKFIDTHPRPVMRPMDVPQIVLPKVATGYALASALVVLVVLIAAAI